MVIKKIITKIISTSKKANLLSIKLTNYHHAYNK